MFATFACACAAIAPLALAPAVASAAGNSDAAHQCQHGGWQSLYRSDGTGFKNTGDCVSYAARGGTLETATTATVSGTVTPNAAFPSITKYGVIACPGTDPIPIDGNCPGRAITYPTDAPGHYTLTLAPGTYSILGFALGAGEIGVFPIYTADGGTKVEVLSTGQVLTLNWTFTTVSGTVTPTGTFPPGTTYGVMACPPGSEPTPNGPCACSAGFTMTDSSGHYLLPVPPGTWDIHSFALPGGFIPGVSGENQVVTLSAGQALTLNFTVSPPS